MPTLMAFQSWRLRRIAMTEHVEEPKWLDKMEKIFIDLIPGITFAELPYCSLDY